MTILSDPGNAATDGDFVLEGRGLVSGYERRPYLKAVDFGIRPGEVVTVLGANGAGKTTLIMTLAGHLKCLEGEVLVAGEATRASMEKRLRSNGIALITQERSVFMTLSVQQNIRLGGATEADACALFPELTDQLSRHAGLLSGGQQQMLAVARAICSNPRVILADELSFGLGPKIVDRLMDVLVRAARERGVAVVLVEQHIHKALRAADRAYVLRRGEVVLEAETSNLLNQSERLSELYL